MWAQAFPVGAAEHSQADLPTLPTDSASGWETVIFIRPVSPGLVGSPARRIGRVPMGLSFFPRVLKHLVGLGLVVEHRRLRLKKGSIRLELLADVVDRRPAQIKLSGHLGGAFALTGSPQQYNVRRLQGTSICAGSHEAPEGSARLTVDRNGCKQRYTEPQDKYPRL